MNEQAMAVRSMVGKLMERRGGSPPAGPLTDFDNFNRAVLGSTDGGRAWVPQWSTWVPNGSKMVKTAGQASTADVRHFCLIEFPGLTVIQADFEIMNTTGQIIGGLVYRSNGIEGANGRGFIWHLNTTTSTRLYRVDATHVDLYNVPVSPALAVSQIHTLRVELEGTTHRLYLNGVLRTTIVDANYVANTWCGLAVNRPQSGVGAAGSHVDNFSVIGT